MPHHGCALAAQHSCANRKAEKKGTATLTITGIGTPVYDREATFQRDQKGEIARDHRGFELIDMEAVKQGRHFVTGLSWGDFNDGKRDKFESLEQQNEMLALLPDLFTGLSGRLNRLRPGARQGLIACMKYSDNLQSQIDNGDLLRKSEDLPLLRKIFTKLTSR